MHLAAYNVAPPRGWVIYDPKTQGWSKGITFHQLVARVAQGRANNNVVTEGNLGHEVEEILCAALSPADQVAYCVSGIRPPAPIHWSQVEKFLHTAKEFIGAGCKFVEPAEAERRATICSTCPYNVGLVGCGICQTTLAGLRDSILKVTTSQDDKLKACGICGCDNKTQVHVPLENMKATTEDLEFPTWCWKAKQPA